MERIESLEPRDPAVRPARLLALMRRPRPAVRMLAVRAAGLAVSLALSVVLGRTLGAVGMGQYYLFLTWTNLFSTFVALGLPFLVLRAVAWHEEEGRPGDAKRVTLESLGVVACAGVAVVIGITASRTSLAMHLLRDPALAFLLVAAVIAGTFNSGNRVVAEALKGRGRGGLGLTLEFTLLPLTLLAAVMGAVLMGRQAGIRYIVTVYPVALGVAMCAATLVLLSGWRHARAAGRARFTSRSIITFWGIDVLTVGLGYLPLLLLPQFATHAEIGRFGVALRLVTMAAIIQTALASVFAPRFARSYAKGDASGLRSSLRMSQGATLAAFLPLFLAFVLAGPTVLSVFGAEFRGASALLAIMALSYLVNAGSGLSYYLLYMTKHEQWDLSIQAVTLGVTWLLILLLGRRWGVQGTAVAFSGGIALRATLNYIFARRAIRAVAQAAAGPLQMPR